MTHEPREIECRDCRNGWFDGKFGQDVECVNGVLIDIDEAHEGPPPDVDYPLAPCHPNYRTQHPNDSSERLAAWLAIGPPSIEEDANRAADAYSDICESEPPMSFSERTEMQAKRDAQWGVK